jgi:hypothetical protein
MRILLLLTMVSFFGTVMCARAGDKELEKYKNFTPDQIKELPDKVRESSVPMMYILAARRGLAPDAKLAFASDLNTLMYSGISDYDSALKAFQSDVGDKPTGNLTVSQIHKLQQYADMQRLGKISFPNTFSSFINKDFARIEGTATILDDRIAWPINHVKITCYKSEKYCEYSQIALIIPNDQSWAQTYQVMDMGTDLYKVIRWEDGNIDAVPMSSGDTCRTVSLNYNFKTKEFFETTRNTDRECKILDKTIEKLQKPRTAQIIDGKKIIEAEFDNIQRRAYERLSSDFRKKVEDLVKSQSSVQ